MHTNIAFQGKSCMSPGKWSPTTNSSRLGINRIRLRPEEPCSATRLRKGTPPATAGGSWKELAPAASGPELSERHGGTFADEEHAVHEESATGAEDGRSLAAAARSSRSVRPVPSKRMGLPSMGRRAPATAGAELLDATPAAAGPELPESSPRCLNCPELSESSPAAAERPRRTMPDTPATSAIQPQARKQARCPSCS